MRTIVIFYAWQGDRPNNINRGFIEKALGDAVSQHNADARDFELIIDQDTQGVSGTPPVTQTILEKIERCDIFLPDLTFVARYDEGKKKEKPVPNPNVLIEYGYALKTKNHNFLIPVMNVAYGSPECLPFDMGHLRHPIQYSASPTLSDDERRHERMELSKRLLAALKATVNALPSPSPTAQVTKEIKQWAEGEHSSRANIIQQLVPVALVGGPRIAIHIFPVSAFDEGKEINFSAIPNFQYNFTPFGCDKQLSRSDADSWSFYDPPRHDHDGIFPGRFEPDVGQSMWFVRLSRYGVIEFVSMLDTLGMPSDHGPVLIEARSLESLIVKTIEQFANAMIGLGIEAPVIVRATLYEVQNCLLFTPRGHAEFPRQPIVLPAVILDSLKGPLANELRPLLDAIWRAAGLGSGSPSYNAGSWAGYKRA